MSIRERWRICGPGGPAERARRGGRDTGLHAALEENLRDEAAAPKPLGGAEFEHIG